MREQIKLPFHSAGWQFLWQDGEGAASSKQQQQNKRSDKLLRREFNLRRSPTGSHGEGMLKESDRKWDSAFYWPPPPPAAGLFHSSVSIPQGPDFGPVQFGHFSFFPCAFSSATRGSGSGSARRVCREFAFVWNKRQFCRRVTQRKTGSKDFTMEISQLRMEGGGAAAATDLTHKRMKPTVLFLTAVIFPLRVLHNETRPLPTLRSRRADLSPCQSPAARPDGFQPTVADPP